MAIIKDEIGIKSIEEIFEYNLKIPIYQRPYTWSLESVKKLYSDILNDYKDDSIEYRLGTVILHKAEFTDEEKNTIEYKYNIVDGQQRLITLSLLIHLLDNNLKYLFNEEINPISNKSIISNFNYLKEILTNVTSQDEFKQFILEKCTVGVIITGEQEEAFQFFDSQNSRGKTLAPHDILKAYHLREMNKNANIKEYVLKWENIKESKLIKLFSDYLFPIKLWSKRNKKRNFTIHDIDYFKGLSIKKEYNYILYRLQHNKENNIYQINEVIYSGEYFFNYVFYYYDLVNMILNKIEEIRKSDVSDKFIIMNNQDYINTMFYSALLLYVDRFYYKLLEDFSKEIKVIYKWSYGLRLSKVRVDHRVINKYAIGGYDTLGCGPFFQIINEMKDPEDILKLDIKIADIDIPKYDKLRTYLRDKHGE